MATGICNMAFVLTEQGEIKKMLEYYDKCLMLFKSINDKIEIEPFTMDYLCSPNTTSSVDT
jgi:hypothetical protein